MKYRHLFWGLLLIAIGLLFILSNLGILSFSWHALWRLWPLILVFWGISILPVKDTIKFIVLICVVLLTFLFLNRLPNEKPWFWGFHHHGNDWSYGWRDDDRDENDTTNYNYKDQDFTVPFDSLSKKGILNLDAAAGNFVVGGITNDYLDFRKTGEVGNYEFTTHDISTTKSISLRLQEGHVRGSIRKNNVDIKLSPVPVWDLNFDIGAAEIDLNLSEYKIDTVEINAGASSIKVKMGEKNPKSKLTFSAGASSIEVNVPKTCGCQVTSDSFLVSKEFEGFEKKGDHIYETPNFETSKTKIYITVKTAVSSITIKRY